MRWLATTKARVDVPVDGQVWGAMVEMMNMEMEVKVVRMVWKDWSIQNLIAWTKKRSDA